MPSADQPLSQFEFTPPEPFTSPITPAPPPVTPPVSLASSPSPEPYPQKGLLGSASKPMLAALAVLIVASAVLGYLLWHTNTTQSAETKRQAALAQAQFDALHRQASIGELKVADLSADQAAIKQLTVTGSTTLADLIAGTITNSGTTTGGDTTTTGLTTTGSLLVKGATLTNGSQTVSGNLTVDGSTTLAALIASGQLKLTGNVSDLLLLQPSVNTGQKVITIRTPAGDEKASLDGNGNLILGGNATIAGTLTVPTAVIGTGNLTTAVIGTLTVNGNSVTNGQAVFTGIPSGNQLAQGSVYINPASTNPGDILLGLAVAGVGKLSVDNSGTLTTQGDIIAAGNVSSGGDLSVTHNASLGTTTSDALTVNATSTLNGNLTLTGATTLTTGTGLTAVSGAITTIGTATLQGALVANNTVTLNGVTTVNNDFTVTGNTTIASMVASGQLKLTGNTADRLLIQPAVNPGSSTKLFTLKNAGGAEQFSLTSDGIMNLVGNATVGGTASLNGTVSLGTNSANSVAVNGSLTTNLVAQNTQTLNLGSPSIYWANLYVGNVNANNISAAGTNIAGTTSNDFTINSDNATADAETMNLIFFRGITAPNALLTWNSSTKQFEFNQPVATTGALASVGVNAGAGLIQGTGGLTLTGTTNVNTSGSAATNLGTGSYSGTVAVGNASSTTSILGAVNINTSGSGGTTIGNTGTLALNGGSSSAITFTNFSVTGPGVVQGSNLNLTGNASTTNTLLTTSASNAFTGNLIDLVANGQSRFTQSNNGSFTIGQASINGQGNFATFNPGNNTSITGENQSYAFNENTLTIISGYATQRFALIGQPAITAATSQNISGEADSVNINGAPKAAGSATIANSVALRVSPGSSVTTGVTNAYGLYVDAPTGATNNYAAVLQGGNVGIGTATPTSLLQVNGAIAGIAVNAGSGLLQGTGGFTITGTTSINASGSSNTSIAATSNSGTLSLGNASGTTAIGGATITLNGATSVSGSNTFATGTGTVSLNGATTVASNKAFTANGTALFKDATNATTAFQIQSSTAAVLLNADTTNARISIGPANGTATGQLYLGGIVPSGVLASTSTNVPNSSSVATAGRYSYVVTSSGTLVSFDVSNPASPLQLQSFSTGLSAPVNVVLSSHYAYVTDTTNGLVIVDVSNPDAMVKTGSINSLGGQVNSVAIQGRYAFVVANNHLAIVDISNPAVPVQVGSPYTTGINAQSIAVQGRYAYLSDNANGVDIIDITNTAAPSKVSTNVSSPGTANTTGIVVQGRYAYVSDVTNGLIIFDVSNPTTPTKAGSSNTNLTTGNGARMVAISGRYVYLPSYGDNDLAIFDVSNPASPSAVGAFSFSHPMSIAVEGRYGYMSYFSGGSGGFATLDLGGEYAQNLEAGSTETGSLTVDGNTTLGGNASIQGGLAIGSSLQAAGNIGAGSITTVGIATPAPPTVSPQGSTGSTNYTYAVTAFNASGQSAASAGTQTTTGNATLTSGNNNQVTWSSITGATGYNVYRTASSGTPSSTGLIGTVYAGATLQFNDTGIAGDGTSAPTSNTVGTFTAGGDVLFKSTSSSTTAFQVQNAAGNNLLVVDSTNQTVNIGATGSFNLTDTVNIANSTAGTQTVNIGSSSQANDAVLIQGGTGASAISLQVGSGGTIKIGTTVQSTTITIGNSSATTTIAGNVAFPGLVSSTQNASSGTAYNSCGFATNCLYPSATITVTAGTWLVYAQDYICTNSNSDGTDISISNGSSDFSNTSSAYNQSPLCGSGAVTDVTEGIVTVGSTTTLYIDANRNGGSSIQYLAGGGGLSANNRITAYKLSN
jgi:hypothetical protein